MTLSALLMVVGVGVLLFFAWVVSPAGRATLQEWWTGVNAYERLGEDLLERAERCELTPRVVAKVREGFPGGDQSEVLDLLSRYGADSTLAGRERVHLAILKLSGGQKADVRANVRLALLDYRDVLFSAERERETV